MSDRDREIRKAQQLLRAERRQAGEQGAGHGRDAAAAVSSTATMVQTGENGRRASSGAKPIMDGQEFISEHQLAILLGVSTRHVRRLEAAGVMPRAVPIGRCRRFVLAEVRVCLERLKQGKGRAS